LTPSQWALLLGAAILGGVLNSLVGGGSFVTFPALLIAGIAPVEANATSTVALWPAVVASSFAYRRSLAEHPPPRSLAVVLIIASVIGGIIGSIVLLKTRESTFVRIIPWLLLVAAALFSSGPFISARLPKRAEAGATALLLAGILQLAIAAYGGYFGGGMGILILALCSLLGIRDIHAMNGLRSILAVLINGAAIVSFMVAHRIDWRAGLPMVLVATAAGYTAASIARKIEARKVRWFVMAIAWTMTAYFFWRTYH